MKQVTDRETVDLEEVASQLLLSLKKTTKKLPNNKYSSLWLLNYQKCHQDYTLLTLHLLSKIITIKEVFLDRNLMLQYKKWTHLEQCFNAALLLRLSITLLSEVKTICIRMPRHHPLIILYLALPSTLINSRFKSRMQEYKA